jgi:hypothetical protein
MSQNVEESDWDLRVLWFSRGDKEFFVFLTIINLMCFADVIIGPGEVQGFNTMGYVLIVIVSLNLAVNFTYIMGKSIKQTCRKWRIKYLLWRRKKLT